MEIVSVQGSKSKILIKPGQTRELGRARGFSSSDRTISRRHISFFNPSHNYSEETRLQFEIVGKNPIFLNKDDDVKIFRRFERGEMESGDKFCVSAKTPFWYALRRVENGGENVIENVLESELARSLESGSEIVGIEDLQQEGLDFSDVDHAKEFGFVVIGHEFDSYPKKMLRDIKNWDWFLEEPHKGSDEDEGRKVRGSGRRKRKKGEENDDEDWTGESEDDKQLIDKSRKSQNPKYITRFKNSSKPSKDSKKSKSTTGKQNRNMDEEDMEDEDEDDETLGGFIVDDQNLEDEQIGDGEEDEEEEELEDEYDEDEDE